MKIGFIGLGKMGAAMTERLIEEGHEIVATDLNVEAIKSAAAKGAIGVKSLAELVEALEPPRVAWVMVPHGDPTDSVLTALGDLLSKGDIVVDGGNSHYKKTMQWAAKLQKRGIALLDVGTSGGIEGARDGACLMIGGEPAAFAQVELIFKSLAVEGGYALMGPSGAGHYVKMVHNGVEYALLQSYGEGFAMLRSAPFKLDLAQIAANWNHGSVVRSWLCELAGRAFAADPQLDSITGETGGGTTGEWTVRESIDTKTAIPLIYLALSHRYLTRQAESFAGKVVAALRNQFGGHAVKKNVS